MPDFRRGDRVSVYEYIGDDTFLKRSELSRKGLFRCTRCHRELCISFSTFLKKKVERCINCSKQFWDHNTVFGDLTYNGPPQLVYVNSTKKYTFSCACGKTKNISSNSVTSGYSRSCGGCSSKFVHPGDRIGGFIYVGQSVEISSMSGQVGDFLCDCGSTTTRSFKRALLGKGCGDCSHMDFVNGQPYLGFVYLGPTQRMAPSSSNSFPFKCKCGNVRDIRMDAVTSRKTQTCGSCFQRVMEWYGDHKNQIKSRNSFKVGEFPTGGLVPLEDIHNTKQYFSATCPACQNVYRPQLNGIKNGVSLTCGCTNSRTSSLNKDVASFISDLGCNVVLEHKVGNRSYDIFVPDKNLLIEIQGIRWHSFPESRLRDAKKHNIALSHQFDFMSIFEDEWLYKQNVIKNLLRNRLSVSSPVTSLRPSKCEIRKINHRTVSPLYDEHHYIGACGGKINYGVFWHGRLIGAASFRSPSRKSKYDFEISRMVMNPEFRVHGIWGKILQEFIREYSPSSIVSFSDNRLFPGGVYEKIGFKYDGPVAPDYYWVRGRKRFHKSGLRKTSEERASGLTETQLREAQGYKKIWDLGKKRWVWTVI